MFHFNHRSTPVIFKSLVASPFFSSCPPPSDIVTMLFWLAPPILLLFTFQGLPVGASGSLDIALNTGTFRGVAVTAERTEKWLGIPYTQPPVGSLRFKAPLPIRHVSANIQNATAFGAACSQPPNGGLGAPISEHCLFLNVIPSLVLLVIAYSRVDLLYIGVEASEY